MSLIFYDNSRHVTYVRNQRSFVKHRCLLAENAQICHLEVMVVYLTGYLPDNL